MIPPEITAYDLMFAAHINDWRLELKSTNWLGYWIIQLTSESHEVVDMLINFDHLYQVLMIITGRPSLWSRWT